MESTIDTGSAGMAGILHHVLSYSNGNFLSEPVRRIAGKKQGFFLENSVAIAEFRCA